MTMTWVVGGLTAVAALAGWRAAFVARRRERQWRRYRLLADQLPGALLVFDRRLRHVLLTGRGLRAFGIPAGDAHRTLAELFAWQTRQILEPAYRAALEGRESHIELPLNDRDWVVTVSPAGRSTGVLIAADVTERKRRERRLTELASRDPLTGVWNRRRLDEELGWLLQGGGDGSLLLLDLDGFKRVNDTLGHEGGDRLLRSIAAAVQASVRRSDVVARVGGDEFAVLLPGTTQTQAHVVAESIRAAVRAVWPLGLPGGVSIGVGAAAAGLGRADSAMYAVKRADASRTAYAAAAG